MGVHSEARIRIMKKLIFSILVILFSLNCSSTRNLGIVTKNQLKPGSLLTSAQDYDEIGIVRGMACRHFFLGVLPVGDSTVTKAIDSALESGGDALINVSVTNSLYGFVPIYNIFCYTCSEVEGIAIEFENQ